MSGRTVHVEQVSRPPRLVEFVVKHCEHLDYYEVLRCTLMSSTVVDTTSDRGAAVHLAGELAHAEREALAVAS